MTFVTIRPTQRSLTWPGLAFLGGASWPCYALSYSQTLHVIFLIICRLCFSLGTNGLSVPFLQPEKMVSDLVRRCIINKNKTKKTLSGKLFKLKIQM